MFSTFNGTGGTANQLILDYGSKVSGLRLIVNGAIIMASPAVSVPANTYTHLAATYSNGSVRLYVNGNEVRSATAGSGVPVIDNNDGRRIQVGEDWLYGAGAGDQTFGYIDDILIYDRAMSSNEVAFLASVGAGEFFSTQDGILYTVEGDTDKATDSLAESIASYGVFSGSGVMVSSDMPKFGSQSLYFTSSGDIELKDSKCLGDKFTLAACFNTPSNSFQRLWASYLNGGVASDELVIDIDPKKRYGWSCRFLHSDQAVMFANDISTGVYHHVAATYDNGVVRLYLDGEQVSRGTSGTGAVKLARNLLVGEDHGNGGNEQLYGHVDDLLFYTNALSLAAIRQVAYSGADAYFAGTLSRPGILYSAEGDSSGASDLLTSDGAQDGVFTSAGVTVSAGNPKFGRRAFSFVNTLGNEVHDVIRLSGTKAIGERFTLAAYVDTTALTSHQRLFSSYTGSGAVNAAQVLFDFDPDSIGNPAMRFYCNAAVTTASTSFNDGAYHHLAATYDNGEVRLYLDGAQVGIGTNGTGAVTMAQELQIGEDVGTFGADEQLVGDVDDIVVLFEVLSPGEINTLMTVGAREFFGLPALVQQGTIILIH